MPRAQIVGWSHSHFGKSDLPDTESLIGSILPQALERWNAVGYRFASLA